MVVALLVLILVAIVAPGLVGLGLGLGFVTVVLGSNFVLGLVAFGIFAGLAIGYLEHKGYIESGLN